MIGTGDLNEEISARPDPEPCPGVFSRPGDNMLIFGYGEDKGYFCLAFAESVRLHRKNFFVDH